MQAIGIHKTGGLDVIESLELPVPVPGPNEVLVKIEYAGVSLLDARQREGTIPTPPLPFALGVEAAGTIVSLPTDLNILSDEEFMKRGLTVGGRVAFFSFTAGCFAEYAAAAWYNVAPLPDRVSLRDGAALVAQGATAVTFVEEAYKVQPGDHVLVHAVAGGLGLCFAQIIAARGGIVIGTTSTPEKAEIAKAHGATHVVLYKNEDVVTRVLDITKGKGVQAIYDSVGKDTFEANFKMIATKGTIVTTGQVSGMPPPFSPRILYEKNIKYLYPGASTYLKDPADGRKYYNELYRLAAEGALNVIVHKEYPFTAEGVRESQKTLSEGSSVGKLVIKVA